MQFFEIVPNNIIYRDINNGLINNKNNPRLNTINFLKHKNTNADLFYYVLKDDDIGYLAITSILKNSLESNISNFSIANFQSLYRGKEYGKKLLNHILDIFKNVWLMADPSQEKSLIEYYRNNTNLKEFKLDNSIYNKPLYFYYSINFNRKLLPILFDYIKTMFDWQNCKV